MASKEECIKKFKKTEKLWFGTKKAHHIPCWEGGGRDDSLLQGDLWVLPSEGGPTWKRKFMAQEIAFYHATQNNFQPNWSNSPKKTLT